MVLRRAMYVSLALLVAAAGSVVCARAAAGQTKTTPAKPKSSASSASGKSSATGSKAHHSTKKASSHKKERGQQAPTPERISEIQQALAKDGSFAGSPNGKWGDSTVEAVKNFQGSHGLAPTGKLDAPTLQKLGLGSQTAGVAAPTPPPNSTSRLVSSSAAQSGQRQ
jgi:peptidoglycan hydrolase-like protein with peptidoglycan-binding domain